MHIPTRYIPPEANSEGWTWEEAYDRVTSPWSLLEITDAALHAAAKEQMQENGGVRAWTALVGAYTYPHTAWRWPDGEYLLLMMMYSRNKNACVAFCLYTCTDRTASVASFRSHFTLKA